MKKNLFVKIIALATAAVLTAATLASCAGGGDVKYTVNVKDSLGTPYSDGIVVKFMQDGEQIAMQTCNEKGISEKTLPAGEYDVELSFTAGEDAYHYAKGTKLTAKENSADIIVSVLPEGEPSTIVVSSEEYSAYAVKTGCTYVSLKEGGMSYFLFSPTRGGIYEFSVADGKNCEIGYYGAPHFVQSNNLAEIKDGKFSISVSNSMIGTGEGGTSTYVIGIKSEDSKNCILAIERTGDPQETIADMPWEIYKATHEMSTYTLPEGYEIKEFDLTAKSDEYKLIYNENDGFYHLDSTDGPLVLVRLAEDCDYIACFKTILDRSGVTKYYYDDEGKFDKKVSFSECLLEYIEYADEAEGVYPLTEDLKFIIQERGGYVGWWDIDNPGYIFKDVDGNNDSSINADIAWLLMCCYIG